MAIPTKKAVNFILFFIFSAFVPTLLIGPIDRFQRFNNDVKKGYDGISSELLHKGWNTLIKGLLYKFIIAEAIRTLILMHLVNDDTLIYHLSYMDFNSSKQGNTNHSLF